MARPKEFDQEKIIMKALELFRLKGYEATSIQDLVDYLGIGRGSLYDTFGSKHALYLQALDRYLLQEPPPLEATMPIKSLITHILAQQVEEALRDAAHGGCFMVNAAMELSTHDQAVAARVRANLAQAEEMFYQLLSQAQAKGELSAAHEARAMARALVNASLGLRVMAKINPQREALHDVVKVALAILD